MRFSNILVFIFLLFTASTAWAGEGRKCSNSTQCSATEECTENNCLARGQVKVTISWLSKSDVDLHVETPNGNEISGGPVKGSSVGNEKADGGEMMFDECYGGHCRDQTRDSSHPHVEHAVWKTTILSGTYKVWVENHDGFEATSFKVIFEHPNGDREVKFGNVPATKGAKSNVFEFKVKENQIDCERDSDGDGLCDEWETNGIDVNNDGVIDLDLKKMGADPNYKDIFVEYDWTPGHQPKAWNLNQVRRAFANSNERNVNGKTGIRLHILRSEEVKKMGSSALGKQAGLSLADLKKIKFNGKEFACGKGAYFGTPKDRKDKNCENISKARQKVFHYVVFTYEVSTFEASGIAELPGNDFIVAIGQLASGDKAYKAHWEAGTFMHEFGHNLGLHHGGTDDVNCKTNYLSVMNYLYQNTLNYPGRSLDYSRNRLPTLNESALDEKKGIQGPASWKMVIFNSFEPVFGEPANQPQDWNVDGSIGETGPIDLNYFPPLCPQALLEKQESQVDWGHLVFDFRKSKDYEGAAGATRGDGDEASEHAAEASPSKFLAIAAKMDSDKDGVNNRDDLCPDIADPDQEDRDDDGIGDACDTCPDEKAIGYIDGCLPPKDYKPDELEDYKGESYDDQKASGNNEQPNQPSSSKTAIEPYPRAKVQLVDAKVGSACSVGASASDSRSISIFGLLFVGVLLAFRRRRKS